MNAGILQFTLGLGAGGFISTIDKAGARVKEFAGGLLKLPGLGTMLAGTLASVGTLEGLVEGVFGAFETGEQLTRLSRRTGESVKSLYELQRGFREVIGTADDLGPALFNLQRSLGGVNDLGENTAEIFVRMGLDARLLAKMDAAHQFAMVAQALSRLGQSDAARAAAMIFGRQQGANMLQLARSGGEFQEAMGKAAAQAAIFARNAERFERIERAMLDFKENVKGLFAGLAEGMAPAIQRVLDALNSIDFTRIGQKFGEVLTVMAQSIKDKEFGKLIELSLDAGFEAAGNYAVATVWGIQAAMQKAWENITKAPTQESAKTAATSWWKVTERAIGGAHSAILGAGDLIWNAVTGSEGSEQKLAERINEVDAAIAGVDENLGKAAPATRNFLRQTIEGTREEFDRAFRENMGKGSTSAADALKAFYGRELKRAVEEGKPVESTGKKAGESIDLAPKVEGYKPDFTIFEKMGFVMSGLGNPAIEHARTTAMNTTRMVQLMESAARGEGGFGESLVINQPL